MQSPNVPDRSSTSRFTRQGYRASALFGAVIFLLGSLFLIATTSAQTRPTPKHVSHRPSRQRRSATNSKAPRRENETEFAAGEADDPDARANWFWFQRTYPFNEIPDGARRRAWESLAARGKIRSLISAGTVWSSIGPAPTTSAFPNNGGFTAGRINAIAVSPADTQIVLIGSATGGIWRSTDGGGTFTPVTDNQVDLSVGTIAFAPSNPSIVYAGMGDNDNGYFGTGVLRSTDGGVTWTRVSNNLVLPDKGQCMKILVDPNDPNHVYLGQYSFVNTATNGLFISGIYISTDGGVNWTRTFRGLVRDLVMHPTNPQILYAGVQFGTTSTDPRGVFKSTDGGATWNNIFLSPYTTSQSATRDIRVAVTPANPNRVYVYLGTRTTTPAEVRVEMSDDGGTTWTSRGVISDNQIDAGQFGYNTYLYASPTDANTIYVGTRDVFRSTDGGVTFTNITNAWAPAYSGNHYQPFSQKFHSDQQSFAFEPGSSTTFYCGSDGGLWKTTNSGTSFTSLNATLMLSQFVSLGLNPIDATKSYGGTQDNGTQRRLTGNGWTEFSSGDGGQLVINPLNPAMVFTSYVSGRVNRFSANGGSFTGTIADADTFGESLTSPRIAFYPPIVGNGTDAKIYLGTWRLFICSDCDNTSKTYPSTTPTWTAPAGTTDLTNGSGDVLSAIAVAKSNNNVIYTGSRGGHAMISTNAGVNWTDISAGLPVP